MHKFWLGNPKEMDHSEDVTVDGIIILKLVSTIAYRAVRCRLDAYNVVKGTAASSCKHCNEHLGFMKGAEFLHSLRDTISYSKTPLFQGVRYEWYHYLGQAIHSSVCIFQSFST